VCHPFADCLAIAVSCYRNQGKLIHMLAATSTFERSRSERSVKLAQLFVGASRWAPLAVCSIVAAACAFASPSFQHPFLIPVILCGGWIGVEAVHWFTGKRDVFDPLAVVAVMGLHLFFVAPLLHVGIDYWLPYVTPPTDWRTWLEYGAWLNLAGLILFGVTLQLLTASVPSQPCRTTWRIVPGRLFLVSGVALVVAALLQASVYARFGGIGGYIQAFSDASDEFTGMGFVFMFSESAPMVALIAAIYYVSRQPKLKTLTTAVVLLSAFVVLKFAFGGLRGSRGHLVYGLFWAAGILHLVLRPLPKRLFAVGFALLIPFMYAYGFYKSFGKEAMQALESASARADLLEKAPRNWDAVLLGDLGRCDVQAFILYRLSPSATTSRFDLVYGSTYVGSVAQLIPRSVFTDRPPTKVKPGTDLLFGPGVYENDLVSTFAFGLTGEAMLNFGPVGGLLSFVPLAVLTFFARRWYFALPVGDSRRFLVPFLISLAFMAFLWDTDVLLFYVIKEGFIPGLIIWVSSRSAVVA
jgi:hypothetical protein